MRVNFVPAVKVSSSSSFSLYYQRKTFTCAWFSHSGIPPGAVGVPVLGHDRSHVKC